MTASCLIRSCCVFMGKTSPDICVIMVQMQLATVVACVGWMGVSSGLIMVNKYLMSTDGFHYPMALSCLGMLFSSVASWFACRVSVSYLKPSAKHGAS